MASLARAWDCGLAVKLLVVSGVTCALRSSFSKYLLVALMLGLSSGMGCSGWFGSGLGLAPALKLLVVSGVTCALRSFFSKTSARGADAGLVVRDGL